MPSNVYLSALSGIDAALGARGSSQQYATPIPTLAAEPRTGSLIAIGSLRCVVVSGDSSYCYLSPLGVSDMWKFARSWLRYSYSQVG